MATLGTDPRYRSLATSAAAILGSSSSSIVAAILAQWQCEQPGGPPWPPVHNNPGFVTVGALRSVGVSAAAATVSPGVGFLARFASPSEGAAAYAQLLARGARYKDARAAIAVGDGAKFLEKVTAAGYGTRYSCAISAYRALGGSAPGGTASPATATPAASTRLAGPAGTEGNPSVAQALGIAASTPFDVKVLDQMRAWWTANRPGQTAIAEWLRVEGAWRPFTTRGLTASEVAWPLSTEGKAWNYSTDPITAVADAIGNLGPALGDAALNVVILAAIAGVLLLGVKRLAG